MIQRKIFSFATTILISSIAFASDVCNINRTSPLTQKSDWEIFCGDILKGNLKFPPSAIMEDLSSNGQYKVLSAIIPFGRSPEKEYTDMDHPRSLVYWQNGTAGPDVAQSNQARLIFGYTPNLKQLEVISFNINTGENEFRIVRNYDGRGQPSVEKVDKHLCMTCHQNNLPLFPVNPWSETQENPRIIEGLTDSKRKNKIDAFASYLLEPANFIKFRLHNIVDFDLLMKSNYFQTMKLCTQYCKNTDKAAEAQCQKNILLSALTKAAETNSTITPAESAKILDKLWSNFQTQNPILPITMDIEERENPARSFKNERKIGQNSEDPITRRASPVFLGARNIRDINYGLSCFHFSKEDLQTIGSYFKTNIALFSKSTTLENLIQHWIPNEEILLKAFIDPSLKIDAPIMSQNAATEFPVNLDLQKNQNPQDLFYMSCLGCHHGKEAIGGLVPVGEREKLKAYIGAGGRTADELLYNSITGKGRSMPPDTSPFYQPTKKQKEIMLEWLRQK